MQFLYLMLANLLGTAAARVMTGAGVAIVSFAALLPLVTGAMDAASAAIGGVSGDIIKVAAMSGLGIAMSAIGAAIITRAGIQAAILGIKKA